MQQLLFAISLFCLAASVCGEVLFADECRKPEDLWSCSDCDSCTSIDECTDEDAMYRAGYYCKEWPYFNQVAPPNRYQDKIHTWALYLPLEDKQINCTSHNQTTCLKWEERKESKTELAVTDCVCEDYVYGGHSDYCKDWGCVGIGLKKCPSNSYDCGDTRTIGSITFTLDCCVKLTCDGECTNVEQERKTMRDEYQDCTCLKPMVVENVGDTITTFCEKWECIDYADAGSYSYLEYETHTCSERNADYGFCERWDWQTDDDETFQNTKCNCVETTTFSGGVVSACSQFDCKEKGAEKISPNLLWALWGLTIIIFLLPGWATFFVVWVLVYLFTFGGVNAFTEGHVSHTCGFSWSKESYRLIFFMYSIIPFVVIPLLFGGVGALVLGPLPVLFFTFLVLVLDLRTNFFRGIFGSCRRSSEISNKKEVEIKNDVCESEMVIAPQIAVDLQDEPVYEDEPGYVEVNQDM
jgi:hypothetical protein